MAIKASIIIPSYGRSESLKTCLKSLEAQTEQHFETIIEVEKGALASIRNKGARRAKGPVLIFIDDDVITTPRWFESILKSFNMGYRVGGVSGPAIITNDYRVNRDLFKYKVIKRLYDYAFLEGKARLPGHFTKSGTWTTGACDETCNYNGKVDYLEACNMAVRRDLFKLVGGFDEEYKGVGDWSEPDLAFKLRKRKYELIFNSDAKLYHCPSTNGAYKFRLEDAKNRMNNYLLFSKRWIKPHWRHSLYKLFLRSYYAFKTH